MVLSITCSVISGCMSFVKGNLLYFLTSLLYEVTAPTEDKLDLTIGLISVFSEGVMLVLKY